MKIVKMIAMASLLAGGVNAANTKGFYIGAGVGMEDLNSHDFDEDPLFGGSVKMGYGLHKYLGVELRAERSFSSGDQLEHPYSVGIYAKPQLHLGKNFTMYGLVGYGQSKLEFPDEVTFNGKVENETIANDISYGGGMEYRLTRGLSMFVEAVQQIDDSITQDGGKYAINEKGVYVGLNYYFGQKEYKTVITKKTTTKYRYSTVPVNIDVLFDTSKWVVKPQYYTELNNFAAFILKHKESKIDIMGHTDNRGSDRYNKILSQNRANAIKKYFMSKGISSSRVKATGYGESRPKASNKTTQGRLSNRRIEARIHK